MWLVIVWLTCDCVTVMWLTCDIFTLAVLHCIPPVEMELQRWNWCRKVSLSECKILLLTSFFSLPYPSCTSPFPCSVDEGFDEHDIPYDVLWLDIEHTNGKRYLTWDTAKFPTSEVMQNNLAAKGRKVGERQRNQVWIFSIPGNLRWPHYRRHFLEAYQRTSGQKKKMRVSKKF